MPKIKATTHVATRYEEGKVKVQMGTGQAGRNAKRSIVLGAGKVAFAAGAAVGAVSSFARGLFS